MKNNSLVSLVIKKERVHWLRMADMYTRMTDFGSKFISYPILVVLVSFFHYGFLGMHTAFEFVMFLFKKDQFVYNMKDSHKKTDKTIKTLAKHRLSTI